MINKTSLSHVHINGKIGTLTDTFFKERVLSDFAKVVIFGQAESTC